MAVLVGSALATAITRRHTNQVLVTSVVGLATRRCRAIVQAVGAVVPRVGASERGLLLR